MGVGPWEKDRLHFERMIVFYSVGGGVGGERRISPVVPPFCVVDMP